MNPNTPTPQSSTPFPPLPAGLVGPSGGGTNPYQQLQMNLTQIFAKGNPLLGQQSNAASDYFNTLNKVTNQFTPSASNPANVNGIPLALSPDQQNSIASNEQNSSLARLGSLDALMSSMYGTIPQMVDYQRSEDQLNLQRAMLNWEMTRLTPEEESNVTNTSTLLGKINQAKSLLNSGTSLSPLDSLLIAHPALNQVLSGVGLGLPANKQLLGSTLNSIQELAPGMINGSIYQNPGQLIPQLEQLGTQGMTGLNTIANNRRTSVSSLLNQVPGLSSALGGPTQNSSTGMIGNSSGLTPVLGPNGQVYHIPSDQVSSFLEQGGTAL